MDSFREYKSFKSEWKSKKRIPILRVLFVLILLYAGYASGTFYKAYSAVENFFRHEEEKAYTECTEYLLGRDLLVAPILEEGARERMVYLPDDRWVHVFTGNNYEGGNYLIDSPMGIPPVFVRKESQWLEKLTSITIKHNN